MTARAQDPDLGILVGLAYQGFVIELRDHLAGVGLRALGRSDGYVFRVLGDGPINITDLARQLRISKQGAAQIVDDMERRSLVARRPDPDDGRARLVHLTDEGRRALVAARRFHADYEARLEKALGPDAVAALRLALTQMAGDGELSDARIRALYL
jgi:DNA-binding MarR family transcriptional regulator